MLPLRVARSAQLRSAALVARRLPVIQQRTFLPESINSPAVVDQKYPEYPKLTDAEDPGMNGGYINPAPIKRQFRDPHRDWWDKQERRDFGEPAHEDHDLMGMFSPYEYTWVTPRTALLQLGLAAAVFLSVVGIIKLGYPDMVAYPREFEGGLEKELGGAGAVRARQAGDPDP